MTSSITDRLKALLVLGALLVPAAAHAQQLPDLSLEELMRIDAGRVFGASERVQPVTEAPASVTFITAEDIARYGYRTLAEILRSVRGLFVTDDRNFSYLGTRGFGKPGDYNSRILLTVNGHRVNDNVFGQAEIGAEFGMDPAMFERVEIIRGPASSLYGDSAFFDVINVITRTGASLGGASIMAEGGSLDTARARASVGRRLSNGLDYALSATYERSGGNDRLYYPVFDEPGTNDGIAEGLDGEELGQFYSHFSFKNLTFTGTYGSRQRTVPTATFGTLFNEQRLREETTDRHTLLDAEYVHPIGTARLVTRASYDRFSVDGTYPQPFGDVGPLPLAYANTVLGARWTIGARLTQPLRGRQVLTFGTEFIDNVHQDYLLEYNDPSLPGFSDMQSSLQHALYAQDEIKVSRWLILNGGLRYDHYEDFQRFTPRTAVIVVPSATQSLKYLFGSAFRAPNVYETNPFLFGVTSLVPESIDTHELVWEKYTNDWLRTAVSTYWYKADRLITLVDAPAGGTTYVNEKQVRARGLELEAQMRLPGGVQSLVSYALQNVTDQQTGAMLPNSPRHMFKARASVNGPTKGSSLALEAQYMSSRMTIRGPDVRPVTLANVTVVQPFGRALELFGTVRNLFGEEYADPGSPDHRQDSIPQNGRTVRFGLRWNVWVK